MNLFSTFPFILKWDKGIVLPPFFFYFGKFSLVCKHFPPEEYKINIYPCTLSEEER